MIKCFRCRQRTLTTQMDKAFTCKTCTAILKETGEEWDEFESLVTYYRRVRLAQPDDFVVIPTDVV